MTYTDGLIHSMVMSGGPRGSLEAFRKMCDEGFSARDRNLLGVPEVGDDEGDEDTSWEAEVEQVEAILGQSLALSSATAEISAILTNKFMKTQKGKGKRGKPSGGQGAGGPGGGKENPDVIMDKGAAKERGFANVMNVTKKDT